MFGEKLTNVLDDAGIFLAIAAVIGAIVAFVVMRRYERGWEDEAERALPGDLVGRSM